jgi:hypothetical protein
MADVFTRVMGDVLDERLRQERLRESGKFSHTCATPGISDNTSFRVLFEEIDEALDERDELRRALGAVARVMNDELGNDQNAPTKNAMNKLRIELIQVAAVSVAWLERLTLALDNEPTLHVE